MGVAGGMHDGEMDTGI